MEPSTLHTVLPARSSGPLMSVLASLTRMVWPATKYGPAKSTIALRSSLIVYVATTMSTLPSWMNGSRFADTDSTHLILSSAMPSLAAMSLPISTSKPSGSPLGPRRPNSGWSNFVPIVIEPLSAILAIVVPALNCASSSTGVVAASSSPPQAARARVRAAAVASAPSRRTDMVSPFPCING